ncbi:FtsX-like permease family protein [Streptomyces sp. NPDC052002]|uniref:FtsX-like permease family protein n=1 Tax=Streptomyces sp. NPDC052002 TaxID=3155754 RepID=UPI00344DF687
MSWAGCGRCWACWRWRWRWRAAAPCRCPWPTSLRTARRRPRSSERRRDLALLRVVGALPGQVRSMAAWEAGIVAATALSLGTGVALATLAPMLTAAFGSWVPYLPWPTALGMAGATLLLALLATGLPVRAALRRRAITTLAAS